MPLRSTGALLARALLLLLLLLLLSGAACTDPVSPEVVSVPGGQGTGMVATVDHVVDGDTVDLSFRGRPNERARLLGIDTPETVKPDSPVECFGPEASARAHELLTAGTEVVVQRDEEPRDRYGRLLVYLWRRSDGLFVNEALLADGYATVLSIEPNSTRRAQLAAAERAARSNRDGLWGACEDPGGR